LQVKEVTIEYTMPDRFRIYAIGDEHLGTLHCDEDGLEKKVLEIGSNKNNRWVGMGDKGEFITPNDPRWESSTIADWLCQDNIARDIEKRYCDIYRKISGQCDGLLFGNHEDSIRKYNHDNVQHNICEDLGVDDLGFSCFITYKFHRKNSTERHNVVGFFTHGTGGAITQPSKMTQLIRIMDNFDANFYAMGHVHDIIMATKPTLYNDSNNKIKHNVVVGATTGCWFKTYTQGVAASYGERKLYPPTTLGCPYFEINPNTGEVTVGK
jgi:hypothetical protein